MIVIIDYDMGNVGSIKNILHRIGYDDVVISKNENDIKKAEKYILPGVGSFDAGIDNLEKYGLIEIIKEEIAVKKKKILGICLGMQLLGNCSEEGTKKGLGLIPFKTVKFNTGSKYRVPHMGWNEVTIVNKEHPLVRGLDNLRYYFVHSYHAICDNKYALMDCLYGYNFVAAVAYNNVMGVQFHPEKSHHYGMKLLENFVRL